MAKTSKKTPTKAQIKATAKKKRELAVLKKRTDRVIARHTREEFSAYYVPSGNLLTVEEVAKRLGVTHRRVRHFINTGRLQAVILNRLYLVKWSDFMFFREKPRISGVSRKALLSTPDAEKTEKSKR